jgi:hypothetical protein
MKTLNTVMEKTKGKEATLSYSQSLTPAERMKLNKEQEALKREQLVREEILKNTGTLNFAKEKKYQNLANSGTNFNTNVSQTFNTSFNKSSQL